MNPRTTIQKALAVFLLLVLAISIAPRTYFHDLVADHKDLPDCDQLHKTSALHTKSYHCHFDDLVVSAPFVWQPGQAIVLPEHFFASEPSQVSCFYFRAFLQHKENRGPPAV